MITVAVFINGVVAPTLMYSGMSQFGCLVVTSSPRRILLMKQQHHYGGVCVTVCVIVCHCMCNVCHCNNVCH